MSQSIQSFPVPADLLSSTLAPLPGDETPLSPDEAAQLRRLVLRAPDELVAGVVSYASTHADRRGGLVLDVQRAKETLQWVDAAKEALAQLQLKERRLQRELLRRRATLSRDVLASLGMLEAQARTDDGVELRDHVTRLRALGRRKRRKSAPTVAPAPATPTNGGHG